MKLFHNEMRIIFKRRTFKQLYCIEYSKQSKMNSPNDPNISSDIKRARKEAEDDAYKSVRNSIGNSSNLESLDQTKAVAIQKHQNRIAYLKASVQGIVSNIESGINDLQTTEESLKDLQKEIISIQEETARQGAAFSYNPEHNKQLHDLALIWERATTIEGLLNSFEEADKMIDMIVKIFEQNDEFFSIKAYNTIKSLLEFRNELLGKLEDPSLKQFIQEHFAPVEESSQKHEGNVVHCLTTAFSKTQDELIRAIWILKSMGKEKEVIVTYLYTGFVEDADHELKSVNDANISEYLGKLAGLIDLIPEKMDHLLPVLPPDIEPDEFTTKFIQEFILNTLKSYKQRSKQTAHLYNELLKCTEDLITTQKTLLGLEAQPEFVAFHKEIKNGFKDILFTDLDKMLNAVVNIDPGPDSIQTKQKGIYYTQAPQDCMDAFSHCYQESKKAGSIPFDSLVIDLVKKITDTFVQLGDNAINYGDKRYIIATCNNSMDAVNRIGDFAKTYLNTIVEEYRIQINQRDGSDLDQKSAKSQFTRELQKPWNDAKNRCLEALFDIVLSRIIADDADFQVMFNDKLDSIQSELEGLSTNLYQPLYKKFLSVFVHKLIPHFISSFFSMEKVQTQNDLDGIVKQECDSMTDLFNRLAPGLCKQSVNTLTQFRDLMTEQYSVAPECYSIILEEFPDFTPTLAYGLLKLRPDHKDGEFKGTYENLERMYNSFVPKSSSEVYFNQDLAKVGFLEKKKFAKA